MRHREHPAQAALIRFLTGEATRAERRAVVRHLLAGCRECLAVTRPVWLLAEGLTHAVLQDLEPRPGRLRRSARQRPANCWSAPELHTRKGGAR